jgi:hypothetical protein
MDSPNTKDTAMRPGLYNPVLDSNSKTQYFLNPFATVQGQVISDPTADNLFDSRTHGMFRVANPVSEAQQNASAAVMGQFRAFTGSPVPDAFLHAIGVNGRNGLLNVTRILAQLRARTG